MPTPAVPHVVLSCLQNCGCTARQGTGRALQNHGKPRGNPRADDWIFLFYSQIVTLCPNFSNFTMLCPIISVVLYGHTSVPFPFVLAENPSAHAPFSSPFSVTALLCYPSSDPTFVLSSSTQKLLKARVQRKSQRRKVTQGYAFPSLSPVFSSYQDLFIMSMCYSNTILCVIS